MQYVNFCNIALLYFRKVIALDIRRFILLSSLLLPITSIAIFIALSRSFFKSLRARKSINYCFTGLKGMNFDYDFGYSFPLFSSLLKKEGKRKNNELAKLLIKVYAFQTGPIADQQLDTTVQIANYKTITKNTTNRVRATTIDITKLIAIEKSPKMLVQYCKNQGHQYHFGQKYTNNTEIMIPKHCSEQINLVSI